MQGLNSGPLEEEYMILTPTQSLKFVFTFKDYIFYVFVCVPEWIYAPYVCKFPGRPEEGVRCLELHLIVNVTDVFSAEAASTIN